MSRPYGFSWIDKPLLAAMARPQALEELEWLRSQGIQILLSLTEEPPRRDWINQAGLMGYHVPIYDMEAPTPEQLQSCLTTIERAGASNMGLAVHCTAGLGRTGTIIAAYMVLKGATAEEAIARVRELRPGSIETEAQSLAVIEYAKSRKS
jgi:atypical dual specificity phosphatase